MRISEAAERTGLKVSNVRFYERKGLLPGKRTANTGIIPRKMYRGLN